MKENVLITVADIIMRRTVEISVLQYTFCYCKKKCFGFFFFSSFNCKNDYTLPDRKHK